MKRIWVCEEHGAQLAVFPLLKAPIKIYASEALHRKNNTENLQLTSTITYNIWYSAQQLTKRITGFYYIGNMIDKQTKTQPTNHNHHDQTINLREHFRSVSGALSF